MHVELLGLEIEQGPIFIENLSALNMTEEQKSHRAKENEERIWVLITIPLYSPFFCFVPVVLFKMCVCMPLKPRIMYRKALIIMF